MEVATALRRTETVIATYGWRKDGFGDCDNGFCLLGALRHAVLGRHVKKKGSVVFTDAQWDVFIGAVQALHQVMVEHYPADAKKSVAMWNDMTVRDEKEVLSLLRRAIASTTTTP